MKYLLAMTAPRRVADVFVPGRLPHYTYNPRSNLRLESRLRDYLEETGSVLTIAGPTKTGKSVLLKTVVPQAAWVEGQGVESVTVLWERVGDSIGVWTHHETTREHSSSTGGKIAGEAGAAIVRVSGDRTAEMSSSQGVLFGVDRPLASVVRQSLRRQMAVST